MAAILLLTLAAETAYADLTARKLRMRLQKAAQADQADAQVTLAQHLLQGDHGKDSVAGALVWLERAAKQNNEAAKLYLSAALADYGAANLEQGRALDAAASLGWDSTLLKQRQSAYQSKQPWSGDVLAF
jgi:hypothetical protein